MNIEKRKIVSLLLKDNGLYKGSKFKVIFKTYNEK